MSFKLSRLVFGGLFLIFLAMFASASYVDSNFKMVPGQSGSFFNTEFDPSSFNNEMCMDGQDFLIQIAPGGCTPAVVRSDLLEEEDVPVFCKLQAIKINPLIDIKAIDSISFGGEYPRGIKTIAFFPSYSALGENRVLNSLMWDEIGYAVIVFNRNADESSMPDYLEGNLSATIRYNVRDAYGLREHTYYLPMISDYEFDKRQGQFAFFNDMGYLRAEDVTPTSASLAIYSGVYEKGFLGGRSDAGDIEKQRLLG